MDIGAILMMIFAVGVIWGGLAVSITHLVKVNKAKKN